jgi:hypothetical protein
MTADDIPKKKMAPHKDTLPGLEIDSKGQPIPLAERTAGDQEKTMTALHDAMHTDNDGIKNPENEAAIPGEMPPNQQGQGPDHPPHHDLEGQQGGTSGGGHE